jgi:glycosyltransferase involved in cell wall biosynthesis
MMKKILCILPSMTGGGAERFLITFCQNIDLDNYSLMVGLARQGGEFEEEIPSYVRVYFLRQIEVSAQYLAPLGPFRYVLSLIKLIQETTPDAILSFGTLLNGAVSLAAKCCGFFNPVILIEAVHESSEILRHNFLERWLRIAFLQWTYPLASGIIATSDLVANDLIDNFGITNKVHTLPYGINLDSIRLLAQESVEHSWLASSRAHYTITACGRLVQQKGFNILIDALSDLADNIKLVLIGDGEEKQSLKHQIKKLNLENRVSLVGYDRNPYKYIARSDLFVMPSLWEGFGLMLIEAMALGVPVIASDCPSGPRMILGDNQYGILTVPGNPQKLAQEIRTLIFNQELKEKLSFEALSRSEQFSAKQSVENYLNFVFGCMEL